MTNTAAGIVALPGHSPQGAARDPLTASTGLITAGASVETLEGRIALRIAARLSQSADEIPADIAERLRFARQQAVSRARRSVAVAPATTVMAQASAVLTLGGGPAWWQRIAAALPLALLVGGLILIQQLHDQEQISAAADIDAALLADELPPTAYGDPGFAEFLKAAELP
jgi:hypothetical protein